MEQWMTWLWDSTYGHGLDFLVIFASIACVVLVYSRYVKHIETLVKDMPAAIMVVGAQKGELILSNRAAMQLLGVRRIGHNYLYPTSIDANFMLGQLQPFSSRHFHSLLVNWPVSSQQHVAIDFTGRKVLFRGQSAWVISAIPHFQTSEEVQEEINSLSVAKSALDSLSEHIYIKDNQGKLIQTNTAFQRFWANREEEGSASIEGVLKGRASKRFWTSSPDGRGCLLETYQSILMSPEGEKLGYLGISHDVTDWHNIQKSLRDEMERRKDTEVALAQRDTILQNILESSPDCIGIFDENMVYQACNQPFVTALGISDVNDLIGHRLQDVIPDEAYARFSDSDYKVLYEGKSTRHLDKSISSSGEYIWFDVVKSPFRDPASGTNGVLIMARDVSERYLAEKKLAEANQELERLSFVDSLTKVSNRRHFDSQLETLWHLHVREQQPIAIMMCDIDFFKGYNDHYGHQKGDEALVKVAEVFKQVLSRSSDCVARYGGEEFGFLLPNTTSEGAQKIAADIHRHIEQAAITHELSSVSTYITVSIGLASYLPTHNHTPDQMIAFADSALYQAKKNGRNQTCVHANSD